MKQFSVDVKGSSSADKVITLQDKSAGCKIEIFAFGAILNSFYVSNKAGKEINIIEGFSSVEDAKSNITDGFKSAKLSPFVCRMKDGEYEFDNQQYKVEKFYLKSEAIHGLIYDAVYDIFSTSADNNSASVVLKYVYKKDDKGFPFEYEINVNYKLNAENELTVSTQIRTGNNRMPLSDGWHPYFTTGNKIDDAELFINTNKMIGFDEKLLPTGKFIDTNKFLQPKKTGNIKLDNCFELLSTDKPACILKDNEAGLQLTITPDASYPYLQIYTPPHRKSIAIENLSSPPDAFNNKINLINAGPHSEHQFSTTYKVDVI